MSAQTRSEREEIIRAVTPGLEFRAATEEDDLGPGYLGVLRVLFSPTNEWTEINSMFEGRFMERFAPKAWAKTIREQSTRIKALFQHGMDPQIGDKPLGPIRKLEENDQGGYGEVALLDTTYNRDLLPGLQEGLYGASHRFGAIREQWVDEPEPSEHNPNGLPERTITEARLAEFGPVTFPAYAGATAGVRSVTDDFLISCIRSNPEGVRAMFDRAVTLNDLTPQDEEQQDAPAEADAAPDDGEHLDADARREPAPEPTRSGEPLYGTRQEDKPAWLL